jgi:hypothetical protein
MQQHLLSHSQQQQQQQQQLLPLMVQSMRCQVYSQEL